MQSTNSEYGSPYLPTRHFHFHFTLMELHWLPVHQRIGYKILTLVYKALHNLTPSNISDCLSRYIPNPMLRSSSAGLLAYYTVNLKRSGGTSLITMLEKF